MNSFKYPEDLPSSFNLSIMIMGGKEDVVSEIKNKLTIPNTVFLHAPIISEYEEKDWYEEALKISDIIVIIEDGYGNEFEIGNLIDTNKVIYVLPEGAYGKEMSEAYINHLMSTGRGAPFQPVNADDVVNVINEMNQKYNNNSSQRKDGERYVPMHIWGTPQFQEWYSNMKLVGNRLDDANLQYNLMKNGNIFIFSLHVSVWVSKEKRYKGNEVILSRRSISAILAYSKTKVVLIKEFRSPVSNAEGFVYELAGGSSFDDSVNPLVDACEEFYEEVGLRIDDISRFKKVESRQIAATLSTHQCHLYKLELTEDEIEKIKEIKALKEKTDCILDHAEHTYIEIVDKKDITSIPMDFATLGMIVTNL